MSDSSPRGSRTARTTALLLVVGIVWAGVVAAAILSGSQGLSVFALAVGQVLVGALAFAAWIEARRVRQQVQRLRVDAHTVTEDVLRRNLQATQDGIMTALGVQRADILDALKADSDDAAGH